MKLISQEPGLKAKPGTPQSLSILVFFLPIYRYPQHRKASMFTAPRQHDSRVHLLVEGREVCRL